jgi:general secretion pathway protein K
VTARRPPRTRRRRAPASARHRAGVAILMVVTAIALCLVLVNDFGTRTQVDKLGARNNLDQVRAHFLARSGLNLADLMLRLHKKIEQFEDQIGPIQITTYADTFVAAFGGDAEQVESAVGVSFGETKGMGVSFGTFGLRMTPIDGKINVNCAASLAASNQRVVRSALQGLLYPNAFDPVFEEEDGEGWRRDRATQIDAIMDYIDRTRIAASSGPAPRTTATRTSRIATSPKNNAIDSVPSKLVRGVDARFWALFGTAFQHAGRVRGQPAGRR